MNEYYVAQLDGLMDLRTVSGPFDKKAAFMMAAQMEFDADGTGFRSENNYAYLGAWYSMHPSAGYVHGPYPAGEVAMRERKNDIEDKQRFEFECQGDEGFTGYVVAIVGNFGVLAKC